MEDKDILYVVLDLIKENKADNELLIKIKNMIIGYKSIKKNKSN